MPARYEATLGEREASIDDDSEIDQIRSASTVPLEILDRPREIFINILELPDRTLVTTLELLSPVHKSSPGQSEYVAKRTDTLRQDVNLVELDLLLAGHRLPSKHPLPDGDYYCFLHRADHRPWCHLWPWKLPDRLPVLPVPLRAPDPGILIDLAAVFTTAYECGRFRRRLPYQKELPAFLPERYRDWAASLIRQTGGA